MAITVVDAVRKQFTQLDIQTVPYRPSALLNMLTKRDEDQLSIEWRANVGGAVAGGRAVTADVPTTNDPVDVYRKAVLPIGDHVVSYKMELNRDRLTELSRIGEGALNNMVRLEVETAYEVILNALSGLCYTGTGSAGDRGVFGLNQAFDATAYGGLAKATFTQWVAYMDANAGTGRALSRAMFERVDVNAVRQNAPFDRIITTPEIVKRYTSLFTSDRGYNVVGGNRPQADIGFVGASYNGIELYQDPQCPNGTMYFLNSRAIELRTFKANDVVLNGDTVKATTKGESTFGMNFMISDITNRNPDKIEIEIAVKPQLWIRQPKFVSIVRDIIQTI